MKNVNPFQLIFSSIGIAIGLYFAAKYGFMAFINVMGNRTEATAVLALAVIIAGLILTKTTLKWDWFLDSDRS